MSTDPHCEEHTNGFIHLTLEDRPDLATRFDLGHWFEERDSDEFSIDPSTGVKAWAEPELLLHISIRDLRPEHEKHHMCFQLTRSRWAEGWAERKGHGPEDRRILLREVEQRLPEKLDQVLTGASLAQLPVRVSAS